MAVNSINDIWDAVCEECKQKISEIAFDTFFKYLKPESVSGEEFVLSASIDYIKGMIQSVYKDIINDAIEKVMGIKIPAKFIVADDEALIRKLVSDFLKKSCCADIENLL